MEQSLHNCVYIKDLDISVAKWALKLNPNILDYFRNLSQELIDFTNKCKDEKSKIFLKKRIQISYLKKSKLI